MEMPVPYSLYTKVSEESFIWESKRRCKRIISVLCKYKEVEIIAGAVCIDHVHLSVAIPLKLSISNFMG